MKIWLTEEQMEELEKYFPNDMGNTSCVAYIDIDKKELVKFGTLFAETFSIEGSKYEINKIDLV